MISGVEITDLTKQHASELIQQANQMKQHKKNEVLLVIETIN